MKCNCPIRSIQWLFTRKSYIHRTFLRYVSNSVLPWDVNRWKQMILVSLIFFYLKILFIFNLGQSVRTPGYLINSHFIFRESIIRYDRGGMFHVAFLCLQAGGRIFGFCNADDPYRLDVPELCRLPDMSFEAVVGNVVHGTEGLH